MPPGRRPHRLHLIASGVVLKFWTAQAAELASAAAEAERNGNQERARDLWSLARSTAPADDFTRKYCSDHAQGIAAL